MTLPSYPEYKPSGIEWLGDVPRHWELSRLRYLLASPLKYGANEAAERDDPDLPRYVRITDIDESGNLRDETFKSLPTDLAAEYLLRVGDILFARSGATAGKTFLYSETWGPCAYAGYLIRARLDRRKGLPAFVRYFTASSSYWQWLSSTFIQATIQNVSAERYANLWVPQPSPVEQRAIADFLDRETSRLDTLVTKKRTLIERLKEKRTALISRTITRGLPLNAARAAGLDPHPRLKPSGIAWLGEVPLHWDVAQLRRRCTILDCMHRTVPFVEDGIPLASIREVHGFEVDLSDAKRTTEEEYLGLLEGGRRPRIGDILFSRNATVGDAAIVATSEPFAMGQNVCLIRCDAQHPKYVLYLLRSEPIAQQVDSFMVGATFRRINVGQIRTFWGCWPPVDEQLAVTTYLDRETAILNSMVDKIETVIERLREYRAALITAAVTGKIDVRKANVEIVGGQV